MYAICLATSGKSQEEILRHADKNHAPPAQPACECRHGWGLDVKTDSRGDVQHTSVSTPESLQTQSLVTHRSPIAVETSSIASPFSVESRYPEGTQMTVRIQLKFQLRFSPWTTRQSSHRGLESTKDRMLVYDYNQSIWLHVPRRGEQIA